MTYLNPIFKAILRQFNPMRDYNRMLPFLTEEAWSDYLNGLQAWAIANNNRREAEKTIFSEHLAERKHQQEMMKMAIDTNRSIRKMHEETRLNAYKTQSQIATQWARALGGGGG